MTTELPWLWRPVVFLIVLTAENLGPIHGVSAITNRYRNGYGHFYMVMGYAMTDETIYNSTTVESICQCQRRCEVSLNCHSASVVPLQTDGFDCRTSLMPETLTSYALRPPIHKVEGSIHFLEADVTTWEELEEDGYFYTMLPESTYASGKTDCKALSPMHDFAEIKFALQFEVFKKYAVDPRGLNIFLRYRVEDGEPAFGKVVAPTPFSSTGLSNDLLSELNMNAECLQMFLNKVSGVYKFLCSTDADALKSTLCQRNPLNIQV